MLLAGDELGRTQGGNNNAYCQDNETTWLSWGAGEGVDEAFLDFLRGLLHFRRRHPVLRRARHLHGGEPSPATGLPEIQWLAPDGNPMREEDWASPDLRVLGWLLAGDAGHEGRARPDETLLIVFNAGSDAARLTMPTARNARGWRRVLTTDPETRPPDCTPPGAAATVAERSVNVFELVLGSHLPSTE